MDRTDAAKQMLHLRGFQFVATIAKTETSSGGALYRRPDGVEAILHRGEIFLMNSAATWPKVEES